MSLGGRDDIYPAVSAYRTPTPASDGRNRYAEIMSQFGQAQPLREQQELAQQTQMD